MRELFFCSSELFLKERTHFLCFRGEYVLDSLKAIYLDKNLFFALLKESNIESPSPKHILLVLSGISGGGVLIKFKGKKSFSIISLCTHR